jgi:hypothetical protein
MIPETQHSNASLCKEFRSPNVLRASIRLIVLSAIELDRQTVFVAVEVEHIWINRVLSAELESTQSSISKQTPDEALSVSLLIAKSSSEIT